MMFWQQFNVPSYLDNCSAIALTTSSFFRYTFTGYLHYGLIDSCTLDK